MKKSIQYFNAGIFPATVMFVNGFDYDEVIKHTKKHKGDTWHIALGEDREFWNKSNYAAMRRSIEHTKTGKFIDHYIIKIKEPFKFTDFEYCKLAHEVLHICQYLLPDILDRNKENECEAYLHTHLMEQCLKELRVLSK
jgi:hypothetical protein